MADDATSIDDLPGASNSEQTNKIVLEKTELPSATEAVAVGAPIGAPVSATELSSESINKIVMGLQQASASGMTQLPSSHIPMETQPRMQDPQVQANYVPPATKENYIEEHDTIQSLMQQNKNTKGEQDKLDMLYEEIQTPVIVMALFFVFQMPFFQKKFQKIFPMLFLKDGHHNISGYLVKTALFGMGFYGIHKITNYLSEV